MLCPKASAKRCGTETVAPFYWNAALSKAVYAHLHGYSFALLASDDFVQHIQGRKGEFAKPLMLKHALQSPELCGLHGQRCDWVMWMDADAWFHPALLHFPLERFLDGVPADRDLVLGNRVGLNTGVLFLRAGARTPHALSLLDQWVALSPLILCHAFDQAALQLLLLQSVRRLAGEGPGTGTHQAPYNFTCVPPRCSQNLTKRAFWSCNPLFDAKLTAAGFGGLLRGQQNYPRLPDLGLWVLAEGVTTPRLHVVEKTNMLDWAQGSAGVPTHYGGWDYGGNFEYDWERAPHSPTWFISHHRQTAQLFFEGYQTRRACGPSIENCSACALTLLPTRVPAPS